MAALAVAGRTLFAGTTAGLYRSLDGGATWERTAKVWGAIRTVALRRRIVWAGTSEGAFRSFDLGATWREAEKGMRDPDVGALVFDPADSRVLYAGTLRRDRPRVKQPAFGIYKSTDRGDHWVPVSQASTGRRDILALAADPSDPLRLYAGTAIDGVFRSTDRGAAWHYASRGLRAAWVGGVWTNPDGLLLISTRRWVLESEDHGETWQIARAAPPPTGPAYTFRNGDLSRSLDGGKTWEDVSPKGQSFSDRLLAVDPANPWSLFVSDVFHDWSSWLMTRIWRSTDGGTTWAEALLSCLEAKALIVAPGGREVYTGGGPACAPVLSGGGFHRSFDGGATWKRIVILNPISETVHGLSFDPRDPARLFADVEGREFGPPSPQTIRALYRSLDRGSTWTRISGPEGQLALRSFLFPAGSLDTLLAWVDGLWKSTDGGATWTLLDPLDDLAFHNLAVDPTLPGVVYAATPGGLWRISTE